jgi:IclR family transcriptional regulator, KDG regulon repressor
MAENELVRSVVKLTSLFEILAGQAEMGLTEISKSIKVHKSTAYRFLNTLKELGYVKQNPENEKYSLSLRLFEVGAEVLGRLNEREAARPVMKKLAEQTQETIHLGMLDDDEVVYIDKIDSPHTLRMYSQIGRRSPAYCTGVGKVLLAWAAPEIRDRFFQNAALSRFTDQTIIDPARLQEELQCIREQGYGEDHEEHEVGICCVAAPIRNMKGDVTAAISIAMPKLRFQADRLAYLRTLVIQATGEVSSHLGCPAHLLQSDELLESSS